jgi:hypothetical protein
MKSQKNGQPIGCIGCYMGSISQPWDPPYSSVREILQISLGRHSNNIKYTLGGVMINGGMAAYSTQANQDSRDVVESFVLFGDPNLNIYTNTPQALTVTHPATVGNNAQTVTVTGTAGATVCLFSGKLGIQQSAALTNGSATFSLTVNGQTGDTIYVTGTKFNCATYQGFMMVDQKTSIDRNNASLAAKGYFTTTIELYNLQGKRIAVAQRKEMPRWWPFDMTGNGLRICKGAYIAKYIRSDTKQSMDCQLRFCDVK